MEEQRNPYALALHCDSPDCHEDGVRIASYKMGILAQRNRILGVIDSLPTPPFPVEKIGDELTDRTNQVMHAGAIHGWNAALQALRDEVGKVDS